MVSVDGRRRYGFGYLRNEEMFCYVKMVCGGVIKWTMNILRL